MGASGGIRSRTLQRLSTAGALLAIIGASMIGLHDWADDVATQGDAAHAPGGQHLPTS
jgi:hypothetical protein